jgi:hypothetical protein
MDGLESGLSCSQDGRYIVFLAPGVMEEHKVVVGAATELRHPLEQFKRDLIIT